MLTAILLLSSLSTISFKALSRTQIITIEDNEKRYCDATLNDNFEDNIILVG